MAVMYSDAEIDALIREPKHLPDDWHARTKLKPKRGHHERHLDVAGDGGGEFRLILRQNAINVLDFFVILAVLVPQSSQVFRLRRYNGRSHEHTNQIEGDTFYDFHIHRATERYQELGAREDAYAKPTDRFGSFYDALRCLLKDASFRIPLDPQGDLFEGEVGT